MAQIFTLADGSKVEYPDGRLTQEETAWLRENGGMQAPSVGKDVAKSALSGFAEGAITAPFLPQDLYSFGATALEKVFPGSTSPRTRRSYSGDVIQALETLPLHASNLYNKMGLTKLGQYERDIYDKYQTEGGMFRTPETQAGRYANSAANAVGGMVLGGPGAFKVPIALTPGKTVAASAGRAIANSPVTTAAALGAAGEFAGDASRGFDETREQNPLARFAGSSAAAVLAALRGRVTRAPAARPLHEVTKDLSPEDFARAQAETARLQRAGATQNTVGDSLPASSRVAAMEREVSNELGAGALAQKLAGRTSGDIPNLEAASITDIRNWVVPGAVPPPPGTPNAAEWFTQQARNQRSAATKGFLESSPLIPKEQIAQVVARLRSSAKQPQNQGTVDADYLENAAQALQKAPIQVDPTAKGFTEFERPTYFGVNLPALSKIVKSLDTTGAKIEGPTAGMFKARGAIEAKNLANSALREINPDYNLAMQTHANLSPGVNALKTLADNPRALAAQPSIHPNPVREALAAHLAQLDAGLANRVGERTRAADILSRNTAQHGMQGLQQELGRAPIGELVMPVSSLGQGLRIASKQQANAQISALLANPTPANFKILQKLARNNPDLARAMVNRGYIGAVNATTQTEGSQP